MTDHKRWLCTCTSLLNYFQTYWTRKYSNFYTLNVYSLSLIPLPHFFPPLYWPSGLVYGILSIMEIYQEFLCKVSAYWGSLQMHYICTPAQPLLIKTFGTTQCSQFSSGIEHPSALLQRVVEFSFIMLSLSVQGGILTEWSCCCPPSLPTHSHLKPWQGLWNNEFS